MTRFIGRQSETLYEFLYELILAIIRSKFRTIPTEKLKTYGFGHEQKWDLWATNVYKLLYCFIVLFCIVYEFCFCTVFLQKPDCKIHFFYKCKMNHGDKNRIIVFCCSLSTTLYLLALKSEDTWDKQCFYILRSHVGRYVH